MIAIYISSTYIWNIEIQVEENLQLENIETDIKEAGLETGIRKSKINIQEIVNKIRLKRDDLSWIGINLEGTNAIVKIVKAKPAPEIINEKEYCNIVAKKEGIITEIIAQNGTAKVKVGDQVEQGQVLIEGTMEGKYTGIRYVHSLGETKGIVQYTKTEQFSIKEEQKIQTGNKENKYGIKINNFQINFYKTLSKFKIYDTIEEEKKIKIFSDFYLPISLTIITNKEQKNIEKEYSLEEAKNQGIQQIKEQLENEIGQGNKVGEVINTNETEEYIDVTVTYEVLEKIGTEEKIQF